MVKWSSALRYYFYNFLFSHTVKIFLTWKSPFTKYTSWKDKHIDYFFFNRKLNELQVIPISCMKGLEKSHNDFRDCSHWETFNIFWCLYLYSGSKHCDVKSKGKKCNLVWYNLFLPRVKKDCWMGYFLVWKAFINTDFFFTIQTWGPLILARYMLGTCMPKNKINVKEKKSCFTTWQFFYN